MRRWAADVAITGVLVAGWAAPVAAALPGVPVREVQVLLAADSGDTAWLLTATLALAGSAAAVHRESRRHITIGLAALLATLWLLIGYSLAFSPGSSWIGGTDLLALSGLADVRSDTAVPESAFVLWEWVVALFAATLALRGVAERARPGWLLGTAAGWLLLVWVPVAHWLRSDGWLADRGVLDGAGALSVHLVVGVTALVLTRFVREAVAPSAQRWTLAALAGTLALAGGSALSATDDASTLLLAVLAGGAGGALVWLTAGLGLAEDRSPDPTIGALSGAVAVSAAAGAVGLVAALALGALTAGALLFARRLVRRTTAGGTVALVHGGGGLVGGLAAPLLALPALGGPGYVEGGPGLGHALGAQLVALLVTAVWTAIAAGVAAGMMSAVLSPTLTRREAEAITPPSGSGRPADGPSV